MAKLPTRHEVFGQRPSAVTNFPMATYDVSGLRRMAANTERTAGNLSKAFMKLGHRLASEAQAREDSQADVTWQQMLFDADRRQEEMLQNVDRNGLQTFAGDYDKEFGGRAESWVQGLAGRLQPGYAEKLAMQRRRRYAYNYKEQRNQLSSYAEMDISNLVDQYAIQAMGPDATPSDLTNMAMNIQSAMDSSPDLSPLKRQALLEAGFGKLSNAYIEAMIARGEDATGLLQDVIQGRAYRSYDPSGVRMYWTRDGKNELLDKSHPEFKRVSPDLISMVQTSWGVAGITKRLNINSGYRSRSHNKDVKGAKESQHIQGLAFDINTSNLSTNEKLRFLAQLSANGATGIGIGENIIHVDMGARKSQGGRAFWGYGPGGAVPGWAKQFAIDHKAGKFGGGHVSVNTVSGRLQGGQLMMFESGGRPDIVNPLGYVGLFQHGAPRLYDLGLYTPGKNETITNSVWSKSGKNAPGKWSGTFNLDKLNYKHIKTFEQYRASPGAQRAVQMVHIHQIDKEADKRGLLKYMGQTVGGIRITLDGIRNAAHLGGIGNVEAWLRSGGVKNASDKNGTTIAKYMALGQHSRGGPSPVFAFMKPLQIAGYMQKSAGINTLNTAMEWGDRAYEEYPDEYPAYLQDAEERGEISAEERKGAVEWADKRAKRDKDKL